MPGWGLWTAVGRDGVPGPGASDERVEAGSNAEPAHAWRWALAAATVVLVARIAAQFGLQGSPASDRIGNRFDAAVPLAVGLAIAWVARRSKSLGPRGGEPWWLLSFAYLCFGAGEVGFALFGVGLGQGISSYVNGVVYLLFYVLFLAGVLRLPARPLAARERAKLVLDSGIVIVSAGLVEWIFVLSPLVHRPDSVPLRIAATVAFQVGDLMVLWALIELLLYRRDPEAAPVYALLALSAALLIATDVAWARRILGAGTGLDLLLGPGWTASHLAAALAAARSLVVGRAPAVAPSPGPPVARTSLYLAYGAGAAAFGLVLSRHLEEMTTVGSVLAAGIVVLIALRHVLGVRENVRLYEQLRAARDQLESKVRERTAELNAAIADLQGEVTVRARAEAELQRRVRELSLLSAVAEIAVEAETEDELIARATLAVRGALVPDSCGVLLVDGERQALRHGPGFSTDAERDALRPIPLGRGIPGSVALTGVPRRVPDAGADGDDVAVDPAMRSELCVPLRVGDRVVGVVDAQSRRADAFSADDERTLATAASQIATAIERLRAGAGLRMSEQNYREVFNATSEAIFVHDAATGVILDVNQTMLDLYGYTREEALGLGVAELSARGAAFGPDEARAHIRRAIEEGPQVFEWLARRRDGSEFWVEVALRSSLIGGQGRVLAVVRDVSERKRNEEALRLSEERFRSMVQQAYDVITVLDEDGRITYASPSIARVLGFDAEDLVGRAGLDLVHPDDLALVRQALATVVREGSSGRATHYRVRRADGRWISVEAIGNNLLADPAVRGIVITSRDVTERVKAEEALRLSEERFRSLVQQAYDFLTVIDAEGTITYATPSAGRALGYGPEGLAGRNGFELVHPDDRRGVLEAFERVAQGRATGKPIEFRLMRADGSWLYLEGLGTNQLAHPSIRGIVLNAREIGERKRAEEEIRRKLAELTALNAVAELAVRAEDEDPLIAGATEIVQRVLYPDDCGVLLVDEEAGALRFTASYQQGRSGLDRGPIPLSAGITGSVASTGVARRVSDVAAVPEYIDRIGGMRSEVCVPMKVGQRVIGVVNAESAKPDAFTEHDEAVLGTIAGQLATAIGRLRARAAQREGEERFRRLAEAAFEGIGITDGGRIVDANARLAEILGYEPHELLGRHALEFVAPESVEQVERFMRQGKDEAYEHLAIRKDGSVFPVETQGRPLPGSGTMRIAAVRDITERRRSEQRIQRQLERLAALRAIDSAITGGLDLPDTLDLFLAHLIAQLHVDAADVLLFEPSSNSLVFAAGKGFRTDGIRRSRLLLGECYAGRAALERRTIAVPDLVGRPNGFTRAALVADEAFRVCFVAPLVAKGHIHGVLEAFARRPLEPDAEWRDYLDTMAGQLAIAIDNRTLFEDLQRSNDELAQAYDTTLEGWSKALELRDRETHGHTARVVELTVRLASVMGVRTKDLVHVRRGALLHDIGKMAIPDGILLKPGPLSDDEWEVMRRHPQFAFELLSPIGFLQPAIDIPYCHHERWDGSGYPRGLAGDAIPLGARIFAVVDTWDALRYDRPYREAWTAEKVREYLRAESGQRFDPVVVDAFLRVTD